jgi:hypothetical protein
MLPFKSIRLRHRIPPAAGERQARTLRSGASLFVWLTFEVLAGASARGGGVTLITHGFNSNVTDWIIPMAQKIPDYQGFPGTSFSCYEFYFAQSMPGMYALTQSLIGGVAPTNSDSGEIIVKLDWSQLSGDPLSGAPVSTSEVAPAFAMALVSKSFIPELGGRRLAEFPLHLIGHSRGGSIICEMARVLGEQGIWVDQLTTLDPHPLNNDGFDDSILTSTVDAPAHIYANVLFADDYYQTNNSLLGVDPSGEPLLGAYRRYLSNLSGGYNNTLTVAPDHSNVHLWYHGTIDLTTPTTDTQADITSSERQQWWSRGETNGAATGFLWSLIGQGNRLTTNEPGGGGTGPVRDGFNKLWNFGAGLDTNRYALDANSGTWPNPVLFTLLTTNVVTFGTTNLMTAWYQYGTGTTATATLQVFLDTDRNPWNGDGVEVYRQAVPGTGTDSVATVTIQWVTDAAAQSPGSYTLHGKISAGDYSRSLYAPVGFTILPSAGPPSLSSPSITNGLAQFTVHGAAGQTLIVQGSTDLTTWASLATNTLAGTTWDYVDGQAPNYSLRFYRAVAAP